MDPQSQNQYNNNNNNNNNYNNPYLQNNNNQPQNNNTGFENQNIVPGSNSNPYYNQPNPYYNNQNQKPYNEPIIPNKDIESQNHNEDLIDGKDEITFMMRLGFIKKVYAILSVQLLFTVGFICLTFNDSFAKFLLSNIWIFYVCIFLYNNYQIHPFLIFVYELV